MTATDADILDGFTVQRSGYESKRTFVPTRRGPLVSHGVTLPDVFTMVSRFRAQDTTFCKT